jgi:methyltransferase OMS1, mitochondrial
MSSNTYFWVCCLFGFALSTYGVYTYMSYSGAQKKYEKVDLPQNADVSARWMDMSRNFDDEVELSEKLMFIRSKRESLCREARGNVLEVSAGTGRNMDLYRLDPALTTPKRRIKSLVINDLSEIMLYQAEKKLDALQDKISDEKRRFSGQVQFVVGDAGDKRLIKRPEGGFDTIIQTMGICSETNPVAFLKHLGELCRQPGEESTGLDMDIVKKEAEELVQSRKNRPDYGAYELSPQEKQLEAAVTETGGDLGGKILLLEHGRSRYGLVNRVLDNGAKMHAAHYGCWWNKDIEQVIEDSGLIVERKRRFHFGTTYEYVLRPGPKKRPEKADVAMGAQPAIVNLSEGVKAKGGWLFGARG